MNMFKFEFKRLFKSAIVWSVVCSALIIMFLEFFPSMKDMGMQELLGDKLEGLSVKMLEAFNISATTDFTNISQYIAYVIQYIGMATGIYGAILGVSALTKEEGEGTIEFLYSKPVTRSQIVTAKIFSCVTIFLMFIVIITITTMAVSAIVKPEDAMLMTVLTDIKTMFVGIAFLGLIFMAIGFLISVLIKLSKSATTIAIGVFFTTYVVGVLGKMQENLNWLLYFSPSEYVGAASLLSNGFEAKYIILGISIIVVSLIGTYFIYNKKDLD